MKPQPQKGGKLSAVKGFKLSNLIYNPVDQLSKEQEALVKAREEQEAKMLEAFKDADEVAPDTADDLKETLDKMQAKINSAQRKIEVFKSNANKRVSSGFDEERESVSAKNVPAIPMESTAPAKSLGVTSM